MIMLMIWWLDVIANEELDQEGRHAHTQVERSAGFTSLVQQKYD